MFSARATWQPQGEWLKDICDLLEQHISPTSYDMSQILLQLQHYSQIPDFNNHLAFILARAELILRCKMVRTGPKDRSIISTVVQMGGVAEWPELLTALLTCLDSNAVNLKEGAMDALSKICEDVPQVLDADVPGLSERPINIFLPRLFQLFLSPQDSLRKLSLVSVNQCIMLKSTSMDQYLQGLFFLANDPASEVRKLVCAAFVQLIEVRPAILKPHLKNVIEYMLQVNRDPDEEVSLEACELSAYCDAQLPPENLHEYLPRLIPVLLLNMAYADNDEALADAEEEGSLPDRDQDLKPRFHSSRFHVSENDAEDDDDDIVNVWNLRNRSAAALDIFSTVFGDDILPTLMPFNQAKLSSNDYETWKEREAAVLAIGAIAKGCINGLHPHLPKYFPEIVVFLIHLLDDKVPLIRSVSCWTLSRFSKYIIQCTGDQQGCEQFDKVLLGILRRILDSKKKVQEAACSALVALEKEAAEKLVPWLEVILQHLMCAFVTYQRRNLRIVYDAIGTLADASGGELNQPKYLEILIPPLISKLQSLSKSDKNPFPILECFTSIAQALGVGFSEFAGHMFQRCIGIIEYQKLAKSNLVSDGVEYDEEFVVCCLDLLSGLAVGLGPGLKSLVSNSNLRELLLQCCMDDASDVRQSAFALLGDLARVCPYHLRLRLVEFLEISAKQLDTAKLKESISAANNACWAIGELAIKNRREIHHTFFPTMTTLLVPILSDAEESNRSLIENSAITLGRLAWICPKIVAQDMEHFIQPWCAALSRIRDDIEKEHAFRGLCAVINVNPQGALSSPTFLCEAIASWQEIKSKDLRNEVQQVLHTYKQMLANGGWEQCMKTVGPHLREKLSMGCECVISVVPLKSCAYPVLQSMIHSCL